MQFHNKVAITGVWLPLLLFSSIVATARPQEETASLKDSPQEHFQSAQTFQIAGDYEKAAGEYRQAIANGLQHLGNLRVSHNDYAAGIELLGKAANIAPRFTNARVDLGIAKFRSGDMEGAKAETETVLKVDPQNVRALNLAGKVLFMQDDYSGAANRLQEALQLQPDFDTGFTLALANLQLKKTTEAGILFDEMLNSSKRSGSLEALIGIAYRETGYLEQAISYLNKSIALDPKSARAHSALGITYFLKGAESYTLARQHFQIALSITPNDFADSYYLGRIAANQKKLQEAEKWFTQASATRPNDPDLLFGLGQLRFDGGQFEDAIAVLKKSLIQFPHDRPMPQEAPVHELLAKALEKIGRHAESDVQSAQAARIREQTKGESMKSAEQQNTHSELRALLIQDSRGPGPTSREAAYVKQLSVLLGEAYDNLGVIDARAERYSDASSEFREAAHWKPDSPGLVRKWGLAAFHAQQYDQAITPLERQIRFTPNDLNIRETLGVCYFMNDKFAEAANTFIPALDHLSDNPGVLYAAGVSLARSGNNKDASKVFSRIVAQNPNVPEVHLLLGEALADLSEYDDAIAELSRALELDPRTAEAHYYKGIIRFKQGQMDSAAQEFQAELEVNSGSAQARYQLAVVRLSEQQTDEAIRLLTEVLQQFPSNTDARYQLGKALLEKGNVKGAIENLEAAVHTQPKDYSYYQLSLAYRRDGRAQDAQQAMQMYEHLKAQAPSVAQPAQ
jgi:tetratricopeptide (TPR) repeat protein